MCEYTQPKVQALVAVIKTKQYKQNNHKDTGLCSLGQKAFFLDAAINADVIRAGIPKSDRKNVLREQASKKSTFGFPSKTMQLVIGQCWLCIFRSGPIFLSRTFTALGNDLMNAESVNKFPLPS